MSRTPPGAQQIRTKAGPSPTTAVPSGGAGVRPYCTYGTGEISCAGGFSEATLIVPLTERSTVLIWVDWSSTTDDFEASWFISPLPPTAPPSANQMDPAPFNGPGNGHYKGFTTAITRDPGDVEITASGFTPEPFVGILVTIVAIVGSNTEDECVTYSTAT